MELDLTAQISSVVNTMAKAKNIGVLYDLKVFLATMEVQEEYQKKTEYDYCEQLGRSKAIREIDREINRMIENLKNQ